MQTSMASVRVPFVNKTTTRTHRVCLAVRCDATQKQTERLQGGSMALALAAMMSFSVPVAEAKLPPAYENPASKSYEEELLSAIKSRTGKSDVLPELSGIPTEAPKVKPTAPAPLKFEGGVEKTTAKSNAPVTPVPLPEKAPTPTAPPSAPAASVPEAAEDGTVNNNTLIAVGAIAAIAVAGAAAASNSNTETIVGAQSGSTGAADNVPPNVAEARAWIANWKARTGKA